MTPEEGYAASRYQRPGIKIIMGPEASREAPIVALSEWAIAKLSGDASWSDRDLRLRLGFVPSLWAKLFALVAEQNGHKATDDEWKWLHGKATLVDAGKWSERDG